MGDFNQRYAIASGVRVMLGAPCISTSRFFYLSLLLVIILLPSSPAAAVPSHTTNGLKPGMHWTMRLSTTIAATGTGIYSGSLEQKRQRVETFEIESMEGNSIQLIRNYSVNWTIALHGWFEEWWGSSDTDGSYSGSDRWTIDRATSRYLEVPQNQRWWINKTARFIINPTGIESGSRVPQVWWNESGSPAEVMYDTRGTTQVTVFGVNLGTWQVSHTGRTVAWGMVDREQRQKDFVKGERLVGTETERLFFEKTLGILLRSSGEGKYEFRSSSGSIQETYRGDSSLVESTIWVVASFDAEPRTGTISVDGIVYGPDELPKKLLWVNGSYHTFSARSDCIVVPSDAGVRCIFVGWHDGTGISSRIVDATADRNYIAIYETQYLLTVTSEHGTPEGSGWYAKGSVASFSVSSVAPVEGILGMFGGEYVFVRWNGDSNATAANASVAIDDPKTVTAEWRIEYMAVYVTIAFTGGIVMGGLGLAVVRRRKGTRPHVSVSAGKETGEVEYDRFLARLDQLRDRQEIDETTYRRLRKQYQERQRS